MNLLLLAPAALAALVALLVPLLLHLARRHQQVPTVFAALRWLRAKPKPRRRIRFDEWLLLIVRLLLLVLLVFWLARPALLGMADSTPWTVVAPDVDRAAIDATIGDSGDAELRWLVPGFPPVTQMPPPARESTASLLRELDATLPPSARLTVLVPAQWGGADGDRPRLSRSVDWQVVAGTSAVLPQKDVPPPVLAIRHDAAHAAAVRYLRAAAQAWAAEEDADPVDVSEAIDVPPEGVAILAWLRTDGMPNEIARWVEQGGQVLLAADGAHAMPSPATTVWRDAGGQPLLDVAPLGQGRVLRFARALEPRLMPQLLDPEFPRNLRDALQPAAAPTRVLAAAHAPRPGGAPWPVPPRDLQPWLAVLAALLVLLERWLATSRLRGTMA